jgi:hypothetical protein
MERSTGPTGTVLHLTPTAAAAADVVAKLCPSILPNAWVGEVGRMLQSHMCPLELCQSAAPLDEELGGQVEEDAM